MKIRLKDEFLAVPALRKYKKAAFRRTLSYANGQYCVKAYLPAIFVRQAKTLPLVWRAIGGFKYTIDNFEDP